MRLYVGGLPYQTDEQELREVFGQIGAVTFATVITDRETGRSKGFGFVEFEDDEQARAAIDQLNGSTLGNRTITVNEARERPAGGGGSRGGYQDRGSNQGGYRGGRRY
ncbi:RNA recognition motif domain-containing protein [Dictyobacter kobayashii]|uniref:RNA-binding protein n=1 Tax=Dictyobacter kobayashii TaxID=2014872 RepID=A0A402ATV4_9CHLR|nr:RNA-binding protein [Dictyobacter kobayashii]GCE22489.1 RNA-binding protein [Dictyobacter kobayashii]